MPVHCNYVYPSSNSMSPAAFDLGTKQLKNYCDKIDLEPFRWRLKMIGLSCSRPHPFPEKEDFSVSITLEKDVTDDKKAVGLPAMNSIATSRQPEHDERLMTTQNLKPILLKALHWIQVPLWRMEDLRIVMTGVGFLNQLPYINGAFINSFLCQYKNVI